MGCNHFAWSISISDWWGNLSWGVWSLIYTLTALDICVATWVIFTLLNSWTFPRPVAHSYLLYAQRINRTTKAGEGKYSYLSQFARKWMRRTCLEFELGSSILLSLRWIYCHFLAYSLVLFRLSSVLIILENIHLIHSVFTKRQAHP